MERQGAIEVICGKAKMQCEMRQARLPCERHTEATTQRILERQLPCGNSRGQTTTLERVTV
jgi:hypothetical protein